MFRKDLFRNININFPKINLRINKPIFEGMPNLGGNINRILAGFQDSMHNLAVVLQGTVNNPVAKDELRKRGILPHKSTPWNLFDPDTPEAFPDAVLLYYSNEWEQARGFFLADIDTYQIGQEAKESFVEGIECHTQKLYRSAVLTVLPAAEAEFRRTFAIGPNQRAASLEELRRAVDYAPAGVMLNHVAPFDLYNKLNKHLYEKVKTEGDVKRLISDPIPNRHAAIHGLVHYKTEISSLNALIMTDYVFFLITQIADHLEAAE